MTALVPLEHCWLACLAVDKSPKSVVFPVVARSTYSIVVLTPPSTSLVVPAEANDLVVLPADPFDGAYARLDKFPKSAAFPNVVITKYCIEFVVVAASLIRPP